MSARSASSGFVFYKSHVTSLDGGGGCVYTPHLMKGYLLILHLHVMLSEFDRSGKGVSREDH